MKRKKETKRSDVVRQVETLYVTFEKHAVALLVRAKTANTLVAERQAKCSIMYLLLPLLGGVAR